jgi:hypothetical protein
MANLRYGMKEVANVIFFDINPDSATFKKPVLFLDTLKVSSIENEAETAEARGGQGNNKLISWDFGRTANLTLSDALLSDTSIAMLAGNEMNSTPVAVVGREQLKINADGEIVLAHVPIDGTVVVYVYQNGLLGAELTAVEDATATGDGLDKTFTITGGTNGQSVMAFYEYMTADGTSNQIVFSGNKFPSTYRVVGETLVRGEDGVDRKMQFEVPKAKMQSTFSLTMDVENVATFDFNLEVLMDAQSDDKTLYKITRLDN